MVKTNGVVVSLSPTQGRRVTRFKGRPAEIEMVERKIKLDDPNLAAMGEITITVKGTASLIVSNPDAKMARMYAEQCGAAKAKKAAKNPEQDFLEALMVIGNTPKTLAEAQSGNITYGVKAVWWKCIAVRCGTAAKFKMTDLRSALFCPAEHGDLIPMLSHTPPVLRTDRVRLPNGNADVRVRAEFTEWSVKFKMVFNTRVITPEQLVSLFVHGGVCNGAGEWRPEKDGIFGTFEVVDAVARVPKIKA